ncbi:MAG: SRPBCC family protein [Crocinitomicaceae bacterium]
MKFVKQFLILIFSLVSIVPIVALFVEKKFEVKRSVEIEREPSDVFDYLRYLENHSNFTVWSQMDPNIKQTYSGPDGNVGSICKWNSKDENVGVGEQEITQLVNNEKVECELRFIKPWEYSVKAIFSISDNSKQTTMANWSFEGEESWPWNITLLFMNMDEKLGPDLEKGLSNLKNILEVNK